MTIQEEIEIWKKKKDAVILAHYYVTPDVQEVADFVGDSYFLSKKATSLEQKTIVFCGVAFMGQSAKILNPEKTVLMPDFTAGCPMALMCGRDAIEKVRNEYDDLAVVCYINSTAELKAYSDVCVTSANALKIVRALPNKNIFFIPDKNLAHYLAKQIPEKNFIFNDGFCPTHNDMSATDVAKLKKAHPGAKILAHPECTEDILKMADYIGSTTRIIDYPSKDDAKEFIICTEIGVMHNLKQTRADAEYYFPAPEPVCSNMKKNTIEGILNVLKNGENEVTIDEDLRNRALPALDRMLELAK